MTVRLQLNGFSNVWPYAQTGVNKEVQGEVITDDDLVLIEKLTGSSRRDIYYGLDTLRNGYELGLVELKHDKYKTPEEAIIKEFIDKVQRGVYIEKKVQRFFATIGGVRGFVDGIIYAVRSSKDGRFKI